MFVALTEDSLADGCMMRNITDAEKYLNTSIVTIVGGGEQ